MINWTKPRSRVAYTSVSHTSLRHKVACMRCTKLRVCLFKKFVSLADHAPQMEISVRSVLAKFSAVIYATVLCIEKYVGLRGVKRCRSVSVVSSIKMLKCMPKNWCK